MPEPTWTRIGTTSTSKRVPFSLPEYDMGKTDLYVEIYKVENDSRPEMTNYACIPHVKQWPGKKLESGYPYMENKRTDIVQDWSRNDYGNLEITDWGPTRAKQGSLDWSMGLSAGTSGYGGTVSASYDVPYISREITSRYNETVAHEYTYPSSLDPFDTEAKSEIVDIESIGEAWMDDQSNDDCTLPEILRMDVSFAFGYNTISGSGDISLPIWLASL